MISNINSINIIKIMKMHVHFRIYLFGKKKSLCLGLVDDCMYSEMPKWSLLILPSRV